MTNSNEEHIIQMPEVSISSNYLVSRDNYIDFCKGLLILWVINIHTLFWSGQSYIPEIIRQISLIIDVPAFFFISGYLTKPANFIDAFKRAMHQFKNLYFSYLTLSIILLPILSIAYFIRKKLIPDLPQAIVVMLSVLKLQVPGEVWGVAPVYRGSFWYIWVYFSLLFVLPFFIHYFRSQRSRLIFLILLLLLSYFSKELGWKFNFLLSESNYIYFYLFIYLLGFTFKLDGKLVTTQQLKFSLLINILVCLIIFVINNRILSIQAEKFPPSLNYLIYSLLVIHLFVIFQRTWHYPTSHDRLKFFLLIEWCGKNSYFIYLLQGIVCSIPLYFVEFLSDRFSVLSTYSIVLLFNIFFTLSSAFFYLGFKLKLQRLLLSLKA